MGLKFIKNRDGDKIAVYDGEKLKSLNAKYNLVVSERSDGKTFFCTEDILKDYLKHGRKGVIIRRWQEDFKRGRGAKTWANIVYEGKLAGTGYDNIKYRSGGWYLTRWDEELAKDIWDAEPFCYAMALADMEHDKSTSYPDVDNIVLDEFITRRGYLVDEFILFMNVISTIKRKRQNVRIWMLANAVDWDNPYFKEFGISGRKLEQGKITEFKYGTTKTRVAVEYVETDPTKEIEVDEYFAFDNPKLKMITGGAWEMAIYPHLPHKYLPKDVQGVFYIKYEDYILQCELISSKWNEHWCYIHRKTGEIKDEDRDEIFCPDPDPRDNWHRSILSPDDDFASIVYKYFTHDKVFYQDNEVGEMVRAYLKSCRDWSIIKV